jgi:hypothetical protein
MFPPNNNPTVESHSTFNLMSRKSSNGLKLDIIEKVDGPTPWISPIVVVPKKSGEVRICIDMRKANQAVKREKHLMPTIHLVADATW